MFWFKKKKKITHGSSGFRFWFWPGHKNEPVFLSEVFSRGMSALLSFLWSVTEHPLLCIHLLLAQSSLTGPLLGWTIVASSILFSRLQNSRSSVLWGREDVWLNVWHIHIHLTLQDWVKTMHAFTTRKQTAGFYNWNVGLSSHLFKSEPLELGDKMSIIILQPICPLQLQFFMTSIQSVN